MVFVEAIHLEGGKAHAHIASVRWRDPSDNSTGESSREAMVTWLRNNNVAKVTDGRNSAQVGVVDSKPPYLRTHADGQWTDNLLALPTF
jgi:hypothetical protein